MGHNIEQLGGGGIVVCWNSKVLWHLSQGFWNWLSVRQWKAYLINLFELPSVLEYQFCENRIAFSITYLLNCTGIYNAFILCFLWSIYMKCNIILQTEQYVINELINRWDMWGGKYAERLNLLYMQGIKHIYLVNYRPRLLLNKMQG
jgi:hypothetical protein